MAHSQKTRLDPVDVSWASYGSPTLALSSKCLAQSDKSGGVAAATNWCDQGANHFGPGTSAQKYKVEMIELNGESCWSPGRRGETAKWE
jgi:hypothetical protein